MALDIGPDRFVDPFKTIVLSAPNVTSWLQTGGSPTVTLNPNGNSASFTTPATQSGCALTFEASTSSNATIPDGTFETGTTGWFPFNATGVQDSVHTHGGTYALKASPTGLSADVGCTVTGAQPSASYTISAWFYTEVTPGRALTIYATCTNASNVKTTTQSTSFFPTNGTWTQNTYTFTSTADLSSMRIGVILSGSSSIPTTTVWIDDVTITGPGNAPETDSVTVNVYPWHEWKRTSGSTWQAVRISKK